MPIARTLRPRFRTDCHTLNTAFSESFSILSKSRSGERPLYRPREWKREEREKEKKEKREKWYSKGGYESIMFVPATQNEELRRTLQKEINKTAVKIKVVEKSGASLASLLQRSNPLKERRCQREDCFVCRSDGNGDCSKNEIVYEIRCNTCDDVYIGETSRNAYTRGKEHLTSLNNKEQRSPWNHCRHKHDGNIQEFKMSVKAMYQNDAMARQTVEAMCIREVRKEKSMNLKEEWNAACIPRATMA